MSFSEGERICQHFPFVGFFHSLHWSFRTPTGTIAGWRLSPHVIHRESSVVFCALCTRGTVLLLWTSVVCAPAGVHRCFLAWCCWCLHFLFRCVCAIIKPGSFESFFCWRLHEKPSRGWANLVTVFHFQAGWSA